MKPTSYILLSPLIISFLFILFSCSNSAENQRMDRAEALMECCPYSAMQVLDSVSEGSLTSNKDKARLAILKSMALDKNYIDTISFDVIQPAIDYYLTDNNGNPDERLRTLYYQGRIYCNRHEDENAMKSFLQAIELKDEISDSLTLARNFFATGFLYYSQRKFEAAATYFKISALFHNKLKRSENEIGSLYNALESYSILNDTTNALIVMKRINNIPVQSTSCTPDIVHGKIIYAITFLSDNQIKNVIDPLFEESLDDEILLDLVLGYLKIGDINRATQCFEFVQRNLDTTKNILKYLSLKSMILEEKKQYSQALRILRNYNSISDSIYSDLMSEDLLFSDKKYELEKAVLVEKQRKTTLRHISIISCLGLVIIICIVLYRLRIVELNKIRMEKTKLEVELTVKELKEEIKDMEDKKHSLEKDIETHIERNLALKTLVKNRQEIINGLIASKIANNKKYSQTFQELIDLVKNDKIKFLMSLRNIFNEIYPNFMNLLHEQNLSELEIYYVCLYAMGLRGKEIGEYLQTKRHYLISSEIREKLGLTQNDTNIGLYILRQLD